MQKDAEKDAEKDEEKDEQKDVEKDAEKDTEEDEEKDEKGDEEKHEDNGKNKKNKVAKTKGEAGELLRNLPSPRYRKAPLAQTADAKAAHTARLSVADEHTCHAPGA